MEKLRRQRTINQRAGFHDLPRVPSPHQRIDIVRAVGVRSHELVMVGKWQCYVGLSTSWYTIVEAEGK